MAMTLDGTSGITQMTGSIVMSGSTSGTTTIIPSAVAGSNTATLPAATGTVMVSGNMPAFCATMTTTQGVSSGTFTLIQFNSVSGGAGFDTTGSAFNTSTYRFTPQVAGYYSVSANLNGPPSAIGYFATFVYKNGSIFENLGQLPNFTGGACTNGNIVININGYPTNPSVTYDEDGDEDSTNSVISTKSTPRKLDDNEEAIINAIFPKKLQSSNQIIAS